MHSNQDIRWQMAFPLQGIEVEKPEISPIALTIKRALDRILWVISALALAFPVAFAVFIDSYIDEKRWERRKVELGLPVERRYDDDEEFDV